MAATRNNRTTNPPADELAAVGIEPLEQFDEFPTPIVYNLSVPQPQPAALEPAAAFPAPVAPIANAGPVEPFAFDVKRPENRPFKGRDVLTDARDRLSAFNADARNRALLTAEDRTALSAIRADATRIIDGANFEHMKERGGDWMKRRMALQDRLARYYDMSVGDEQTTVGGHSLRVPAVSSVGVRVALADDGDSIVAELDDYVADRQGYEDRRYDGIDDQLRAHAAHCRVPLLRRMLRTWRDVESQQHQPIDFLYALGNAIRYYAAAVPEFKNLIPRDLPDLQVHREALTATHKEAAARGINIFGSDGGDN